MFSGIVEELGRVHHNAIAAHGRLMLTAPLTSQELAPGDSVAVNGCCLTVIELDGVTLTVDVMPETGRRTNLGALHDGDAVNLEAALRYGDRVGGHLVSGHVDATAEVLDVHDEGNARRVRISLPSAVAALVASQGSIAVDGISLTVVSVDGSAFTVSLIPHTLQVTVAGGWRPGSVVNLEADLIARQLQRLLEQPRAGARA